MPSIAPSGNRPALFEKAARSGADAIILDLEDSVPTDEKSAARGAIEREWPRLTSFDLPLVIRVNLRAVESYRTDRRHQAMSASLYANPHNRGALVEQLDVMLLGAAQVDLDFNVNVTTDAGGVILGGSGGHADTAAGSKLALVTTRLAASAGPKIVERVGCVTTPGESIDAVVTEAGVAVHPRRGDLRERLVSAGIEVLDIGQLHQRALALAPAGASTAAAQTERIVGVVEYRDGRVIDVIRQVG